jgi:hypothetical protein
MKKRVLMALVTSFRFQIHASHGNERMNDPEAERVAPMSVSDDGGGSSQQCQRQKKAQHPGTKSSAENFGNIQIK